MLFIYLVAFIFYLFDHVGFEILVINIAIVSLVFSVAISIGMLMDIGLTKS